MFSFLRKIGHHLAVVTKSNQAKRLVYFCVANVFVIMFLFYMCHTTGSLALTAFTYLTIFDLFSLLTALLSIWIKFQSSHKVYQYGYKRFEVLAIFSSTILIILGAFFCIKEGVESLFETDKEVHTSRLIPAVLVGFFYHMFITVAVKNEPFDYVAQSSTSSWLQEHFSDLSENFCYYVPGLHKILLPRVNPLTLLGFADLTTVLVAYFLLQMGSTFIVDTYASIAIAILTIGTMLPFSFYTGKILLQTTPAHLVAQLDKTLREASTLDGVLEFSDEHFWTLSLGVLVGSLHVRVRRDADEQLVLAHVWNKLAGLVQILTIHIFKDDWMRRTTHQLVYNSQQFAPTTTGHGHNVSSSHQHMSGSNLAQQQQYNQHYPITSTLAAQQQTPSNYYQQTSAAADDAYKSSVNTKTSHQHHLSASPSVSPRKGSIDSDYVVVNRS